MIAMNEICKDFDNQSAEIKANLLILLEKINKVRTKWAKPMTVSSGLRTMEEHLAIYAKKGITDQSKIPMRSKHLFGQALDISDPNQELQKWCLINDQFLRETGLWMESFSVTKNWVHFQIVPFGSFKEGGTLYFKP